ncbi:MAG: HEAT repeat domain-containing protein [Cyanobacteria bacterium]|nr:HEAT repeat domain-containing protein [Cyanobacteriota bacterium]
MAQRTASSADATRTATAFARAMTLAMRTWGFYPPEHPAVALAVERLGATTADAAAAGLLQIAVTPHALLVEGQPIETTDLAVAECAELLHDRDLLQITIVSAPPDATLRSLLNVLSLDRVTRREQGGPAAIWGAVDQSAILLEQIDYQEILEREFDDQGAARRDSTWKSIVRSIVVGRSTFSPEEQQRLLDISRDVGAIGELTRDAKEPFTTPDGSPLVTTQAAVVVAVYRHIASTVSALEPERAQETMDALALATGSLDPTTALEVIAREESAEDRLAIVSSIRRSFDDQQVAMLLAKAVAAPGHAAGRLAQVLDTLAPDNERKKRVLTLAKKLASERDLGGKRPIDDIRKSLDELLLKYDDTTYVSKEYASSMDVAASRASDLLARGLPPEMEAWLKTLQHDSVRRLSGQLLIDLMNNETRSDRMAETTRDIGVFAEELLMAGAYDETVPLIDALSAAGARRPGIAPEACHAAIDSVARSSAMIESVTGIADQSAQEFGHFERLALALGPPVVTALISGFGRQEGGAAADRITNTLVKIGAPAIPAMASAIDDPRWFVQRELAKALGQIGTAAAVPPLQAMLRRTDGRVLQTAVTSLAKIDDPAGVRALHTVLKAATGEARSAVINALVGLKNARVVPLLMRILQDSDPFSADHSLVLETLSAIASLQDERAVPPVAQLARARRWLSWRKTTRLREGSLRTLARIGTPTAQAAIDDLKKNGDYFLRRMASRIAAEAR